MQATLGKCLKTIYPEKDLYAEYMQFRNLREHQWLRTTEGPAKTTILE